MQQLELPETQIERGARILEEGRPSREADTKRLVENFGQAIGSEEWRVPMKTLVTIKRGQTLKFNPPMGSWVNEPSDWQRFAQKYKHQECVAIGVDLSKRDTPKIVVRFADGTEHPMWTEYLLTNDLPFNLW